MTGREPWFASLEGTLRRGDLVRLDDRLAAYHGCEYGFVHALHSGSEDSLELRLETGVYTCTDPKRVTPVSNAIRPDGP